MGYISSTQVWEDATEAELQAKFRGHIQDLKHYHGENPYNGTWSTNDYLKIEKNRQFDDIEAAKQYVLDNSVGGEYVLAVRVPKRTVRFALSAKGKAIQQKLSATHTTLYHLPGSILNRVKAGKSKYRTCAHCGSSIAVSFLQTGYCPVCRKEMLMTATDVKQKARLEADIKALNDKLAAGRKSDPIETYVWVLGGWGKN